MATDKWITEAYDNGVKVHFFNGDGYVKRSDYETLLLEVQALENELEAVKNEGN